MSCDQTHLLSPYLDGELPASSAAAVRDHLASCADCAAEADALRGVGRLMGMARRSNLGEPSEQVMDRLRLHVQGLIETSDYGLLRIARLFTGLAASVLIAGIWLLNHQPVQPSGPVVVVAMNAAVTPEGAGTAATATGRGKQDTRSQQAGIQPTGLGTPETGGNQSPDDLAPPRKP